MYISVEKVSWIIKFQGNEKGRDRLSGLKFSLFSLVQKSICMHKMAANRPTINYTMPILYSLLNSFFPPKKRIGKENANVTAIKYPNWQWQ